MSSESEIKEVAVEYIAEKKARIEARFLASTKRLAERAAQLNGMSLTEYLSKLVLDDAPKVLKRHKEIKLTSQQFDRFLQVCSGSQEPSTEIKDAAKLLDDEGF
jgi:uncharacterized protein (DUF1778 family)